MEYHVERVRAIVRVRQVVTSSDDKETSSTSDVDNNPKSIVVTTNENEPRKVNIRARNGKDRIEYVFDAVYGVQSQQEHVYEYIKPFISGITEGLNTTIFAYGQTGSGKTHTMLGVSMENRLLQEGQQHTSDDTEKLNSMQTIESESISTPLNERINSDWGVIPRAIYDLFFQLNNDSSSSNIKVLCSYMQVKTNIKLSPL